MNPNWDQFLKRCDIIYCLLQLLIVLNSLEHVRKSVEMLPGDLKLLEETLPSPVRTGSNNNYEPTTRQAAGALLDEAVEQLDARVLRVIGHLAEQMRPEVRRHVFHLAWSPDSLPAESALAPLLDSLDIKLTEFRAGLLDSAFKRALIGIWDILLVELESQGDANTGEKLTSFYERLHKALQLLEDFFHAEGAGVSIEGLHTPTWYRLSSRLDLDRTPTQALINLYYKERMDEQQNATEAAGYGVLTVRAYFHHDSLCVEVLGARDVIPLDPNGLSDPFVIVELLPRTTFSHCVEQRTAVHRRTLNPVFDECFEFSVTAKQCRGDGSAILFTVMDYDVITANDFAGEAFLQLLSIPGISNGGYGADNFHGLRPIELPLMQQANKGHPVLKVLETRVWDKLAQDFVKKQKERFMS
ncbi:hypothetical protein QYM36_008626 [Artemia franciscana]|uniref:Uncharacterized protein n=1 Tax=Artemia franciscana TaxID=6661 RepID=A0AA88HPH8_ARTSF|nr:hypothetical protein QYM36_008626 [Artemia franciscana]